MIIDSSALVAIVRAEPDSQRCIDRLLQSSSRHISAANLLETYLVIDGQRNPTLSTKLDTIITVLRLVIVPVDRVHVEIAREAFRLFGKGSGQGARLNFGDCFAYALAKFRNEPLLYIGNDFSQTDITSAL